MGCQWDAATLIREEAGHGYRKTRQLVSCKVYIGKRLVVQRTFATKADAVKFHKDESARRKATDHLINSSVAVQT